MKNFPKLFGYKCDVFAKILYMNMSKQKDRAMIDFYKFVKVFENLHDEVAKIRNRCVFNILDVKKNGYLDIMMLIQMLNNIDKDTYFAQELLVLIREYKSKNILMTAGFQR